MLESGSNSADAARTDQSPPDTPSSSSSGKSWADVAGDRSPSPTRSPTGTSSQSVTGISFYIVLCLIYVVLTYAFE